MTSNQDYSPENTGTPPSQWTHFKSKNERRHHRSHASHKNHNSNHQQTHTDKANERQPIYFSNPNQIRKRGGYKNAPFLIIFASLGVILIAIGMYLFRNQVAEQVTKIANNVNLQQVTNVELNKEDLTNSVLLTADGYLQKYSWDTNELSILDQYTAEIPGNVYSIKPNPASDIFLIASSQQEQTGQTNFYFILNLQTGQLLNIASESLAEIAGSTTIDNSLWNKAGNQLLITTILNEDEQDVRQYRVTTVDPTSAHLTQIAEVSAHRFKPFYFEGQTVFADRTNRTEVSNETEDDDGPVDPTVTITEDIVTLNLAGQSVRAIQEDVGYRLASNGGNFYTLQVDNSLVFRPYEVTSSQGLTVDFEAGTVPISVSWTPDNQHFVLMTRNENGQTQLQLYTADGEQVSTISTEVGSYPLIAADGSILISEVGLEQVGAEEAQAKRQVTLTEIDPESGEVVATREFATEQPTMWAWVK